MKGGEPHIMERRWEAIEPANRVQKVTPLFDKGNGATGTVWCGRRDSNPQAYFSGKF